MQERTASAEVRTDVSTEVGPEAPHLVIAWASQQMHLVGRVAPVTGASLLGRGDAMEDDPVARLVFRLERPNGRAGDDALRGAELSRRQLLLTPLPNGALEVTSAGRCPLFLNGEEAKSGVVRPGGTLRLHDLFVLLVISRPLDWFAAHDGREAIRFHPGRPDPFGILGESPTMWELREEIAFAAQSSLHVLVHGASGTGKELAARAIHAQSSRRRGKFVARNAATMPEGLIDAELFGNRRGYPHAGSPERAGLIGEADGGTLFLDEIGEMRHDLQAHLLRVLDRGGEYQRLGEARTRRSDFRLIAATNRPVEALKHDLAARFAMRVRMPGLDERREDIPVLFRHLLATAAREHPGIEQRFLRNARDTLEEAVDPLLVDALVRHRYTHHVRELNNLLWMALTGNRRRPLGLTADLCDELRLEAEPSPEPVARGSAADGGTAPEGTEPWPAGERERIEAALARTGGNVTRAARLLGLKNRYALRRLMKQHGIGAPAEDDPMDT